jgi:hypothetical protein
MFGMVLMRILTWLRFSFKVPCEQSRGRYEKILMERCCGAPTTAPNV